MNSSKTKRKPDQRSIYLPCGPIIHLRAVEQSDYNIGIIEMGFTAGEDFVFCLWAKGIDFGLGDQIVREDDFKLRSMLSCKGFDFPDSGSYPIPLSLRENRGPAK
jgi:hypothetical protein